MSGGRARLRGLVLRTGTMPPESGPQRNQECIAQGLVALADSRRKYGQSLIALTGLRANGLVDLPRPYALESPHPQWLIESVGRRRIRQWAAARMKFSRANQSEQFYSQAAAQPRLQGQAATFARAAEQSSADAYNWLDDARVDLGGNTVVDIGSFGQAGLPRPLSALLDEAHTLAHYAGELTGGLFGCFYTYEDGEWYDSCIVSRMHVRLGLSAGLTARYVCTVCGLTAGECDHLAGECYPAEPDAPDNSEAANSEHDTLLVVADYRLHDPVAHEVTLTRRPRDPLARIKAVSIDLGDETTRLGRPPTEGDRLWNHACLFPCVGFREPDLTEFESSTRR